MTLSPTLTRRWTPLDDDVQKTACSEMWIMSVLLNNNKLDRPDPATIVIGLVNNMQDAALEATERQFIDLLDAAGGQTKVCLRLFALPEVPRGASGRQRLKDLYSSAAELWSNPIDGLIVTGAEPCALDLKDEPYWASLIRVLEWAQDNTISSVWSCLAAHAAVLHIAGIRRRRLAEKCSGVFPCVKVSEHQLTDGIPAQFSIPHSRYNGLCEAEIVTAGFMALTHSPDTGLDMFVKEGKSLLLFIQGHPEYQEHTLLREYRRDIGRFLRGEVSTYPNMPRGYFDAAATAHLLKFQERALVDRSRDMLAELSADIPGSILTNTWRPSAVRLYRNWLYSIRASKRAHTAVVGPQVSEV
jgi:homoserine O-succinyltransferase/O-acetyltransferase